MTLIELFVVLALLGFCVLGYTVGSASGSVPGVIGAFAGVACLPVLGLIAVQVERALTGRPSWPVCSCGRDEYGFEWIHGRCVARCECGAAYVRRGRQCLRLLPGGVTRPFMRWRPLRGWTPEDSPESDDPRTPYRDDHDSAR